MKAICWIALIAVSEASFALKAEEQKKEPPKPAFSKDIEALLQMKVTFAEESDRELGFVIENLIAKVNGTKFGGAATQQTGDIKIKKYECNGLTLADALKKLCAEAKCEYRVIGETVQLASKEEFAALDAKKTPLEAWKGPGAHAPSKAPPAQFTDQPPPKK